MRNNSLVSAKTSRAHPDYFQASLELCCESAGLLTNAAGSWAAGAVNAHPLRRAAPSLSDSSTSLSVRLMTEKLLVRRRHQSHTETWVESRKGSKCILQ